MISEICLLERAAGRKSDLFGTSIRHLPDDNKKIIFAPPSLMGLLGVRIFIAPIFNVRWDCYCDNNTN